MSVLCWHHHLMITAGPLLVLVRCPIHGSTCGSPAAPSGPDLWSAVTCKACDVYCIYKQHCHWRSLKFLKDPVKYMFCQKHTSNTCEGFFWLQCCRSVLLQVCGTVTPSYDDTGSARLGCPLASASVTAKRYVTLGRVLFGIIRQFCKIELNR